MKKMNNFVEKNKINSTIFFSENGLDINGHILGAYSTAEDIGKITDYFFLTYPDFARTIAVSEAKICSNITCHNIKNTNPLLKKYPEIIFSKTGFTKKAGGSVTAVVEIDGEKFTIVVLDSTKGDRFKILSKIIDNLKIIKKYL